MNTQTFLIKIRHYFVLPILFVGISFIYAQDHPNLILTKKGVQEIRKHLGQVPIFDQTLANVKAEIDIEMEKGVLVPIPKDMAGGYTHDQHKKNWKTLQKAGVLYQILQDDKYALYVHEVLKAYAKMYPTLPLHPQERSYARGKIFWQCLNDANWLVYVSQAYDCIYDFLSKEDRKFLEQQLFIPYADFLSKETPQFFNRIHNHSTWGNVAVGMIGLVMDNEELVQRALQGLQDVKANPNLKDNDGGFISIDGQKTGFLANLDAPFSPDGYYTEGPYYQRYAMYPFMIFAQALQNKKPELHIFEYKDQVLIKSVYALLNLTDNDGEFFPLNDAQKGMSYLSNELVSAVDIAYYFGQKDPALLSIAKEQNKVQLDEAGLHVALGIKENKAKAFPKNSITLKDGANGEQGGIGILRSLEQPFELVMKYTSQGLSHGHYDKLSYSFYNDGKEVLQDYGLARFVNIEQKNGGGYLKENKTWAKQTIAHNTIIQDQVSHFGGKYEIGSTHHSEPYLFDISNPKIQWVSAQEKNAYPNTSLHRTMILLEDEDFNAPLLIDVMHYESDQPHQFDLPFYYNGQIIATNFEYKKPEKLEPLGNDFGYQHLWLEGKSDALSTKTAQFTWLSNRQFYTISMLSNAEDQLLFTRIGANDPKFNLRKDPALIHRKVNSQSDTFISIIEAHGSYSPVTELAKNASSTIKSVEKIDLLDKNYIGWTITTTTDRKHTFLLCLTNNKKEVLHTVKFMGKTIEWKGPYAYKKTN